MASLYLFLFSAFFLIILPASRQEKAGVKMKFSQKGLNYAADVAMERLMEDLKRKALDDIKGEKKGFEYSVRNIKINELSRPKFEAAFNDKEQLMSWSLSNNRMSASADWTYDWKKNRFLRLKDSGSVTLQVSEVSLKVDWVFKYDAETGKPLIQTTKCESVVGQVDLDFGGKSSFIYETVFKLMKDRLDRTLERGMCKAVEKSLNEDANNELRDMQVTVPLADGLEFSLKLIAPPHISTSHLETFHSGCTYLTAQESCPTDYPAMDNDAGERMLSVSLSASVLNNLADKAFQQGAFKTTINTEDLSEGNKDFFDTSCQSSVCMASFFRKIANKHPDSRFEVDFAATSPPSLTFQDSHIKSSLQAVAMVCIREASGERLELFTIQITTALELAAKVDSGNVLRGEIVDFTPQFSLVNITTADTSEKKLEVLGKMMGRMLVKRANKASEQGLPLPKIKKMEWRDTEVMVHEDYIHVRTDLEYLKQV